MNPVLILTHNCLELTKKCVESVWKQDVPTRVYIYDNGSTDDTRDWMDEQLEGKLLCINSSRVNEGVSKGWNEGLVYLFGHMKADSVLVLNNDTQLPVFFLSKLLSYDVPFVTGISVDEPNDHSDCWQQPAESPDFSAFLIRRDCWEAVGPFDESMKMYVQDCDYHVRAHRAGVKLLNAGVPFHHERSSTLRNASPEDRREIQIQADRDREVFKCKYGCMPWEPEYQELFK